MNEIRKDNKKIRGSQERIGKAKNVEMDENILKIIEKNRKIANDNLGVVLYSIDRDMWHDVVEENPKLIY